MTATPLMPRRHGSAWRRAAPAAAWTFGIAAVGFGVAFLLDAQGGAGLATAVRVATGLTCLATASHGMFLQADQLSAWRTTAVFLSAAVGGPALAEVAARLGGAAVGLPLVLLGSGTSVWWTWRSFRRAPQLRGLATSLAATLGALACVWFLNRHGRPLEATGLLGVTGMAVGCAAGLAVIRRVLSYPSGIAAVARAAVDEAVRMRAALVLLVLLVVMVPTLPLILDIDERLEYRVQFLLSWALGGTGLILALLTILMSCGSICGDIDSFRIHMTLTKPLPRWQYVLGKWLGIMAFNLLLVALAGVGTYTFTRLLARTTATDPEDRDAVDRQVLTARVAREPSPKNPSEYEAAIAEATARLERDEPDYFARNRAAVRQQVRFDFRWQWHTVSPDMVSTFVFHDLAEAKRRGVPLQLQLKPRVNNVDVDLAEVRFALWLNGRPWPVRDGDHQDQVLASNAAHVIELPAEEVDDEGRLEITIANRNLVPAGETRPTAISFSPGDGMRLYFRAGGFTANFLRCLLVMWLKLGLVAAAAVAAATMLGFPTAVLLSLVVYATAAGSGFLRDAQGEYNVVADTPLAAVLERLSAAADLAGQARLYEAWRMLLGFVGDAVLAVVPAFSDYDAVSQLATGLAISTSTVAACCGWLGLLYPLVFGLIGWAALARRDLLPSST